MLRNNLSRFLNSEKIKSQKGMTLVEIVIVVTILVSLLAVLFSAIQKQRNKALYNQTKLQMGQLGRGLEMYYTDCNKFPGALDGLLQKDDCTNWGPEAYAAKKDLLDSWNNKFEYSPNGSSYELKSLGADRKEGGDGFNQDITNTDE